MNDALWTIFGIIIGSSLTGVYSLILQRRQFNQELMYRNADNQSENAIKSILLDMLNHKSYTDRSFYALRERVGGYTDDELRKILHGIGARKTTRKDGTGEWWYLQERNHERIDRKRKERLK
jgi:hypothetical protein